MRYVLLHQYSKSQPLSVGTFLPVPPVKTPFTSRASHRGRRVFRPDYRKFLSLLSAGTRALATPLRVFSITYRQQVREVIWSGGEELEKGLARYARIHAGSCGLINGVSLTYWVAEGNENRRNSGKIRADGYFDHTGRMPTRPRSRRSASQQVHFVGVGLEHPSLQLRAGIVVFVR